MLSGIVLEAYSPFGNPGSSFRKGEEPNILEDPVIKDIAEKHKVTIAQVPKKNNACTSRDNSYDAIIII
jgi:diketogulonate reductase-like aldo/keto reductase